MYALYERTILETNRGFRDSIRESKDGLKIV